MHILTGLCPSPMRNRRACLPRRCTTYKLTRPLAAHASQQLVSPNTHAHTCKLQPQLGFCFIFKTLTFWLSAHTVKSLSSNRGSFCLQVIAVRPQKPSHTNIHTTRPVWRKRACRPSHTQNTSRLLQTRQPPGCSGAGCQLPAAKPRLGAAFFSTTLAAAIGPALPALLLASSSAAAITAKPTPLPTATPAPAQRYATTS